MNQTTAPERTAPTLNENSTPRQWAEFERQIAHQLNLCDAPPQVGQMLDQLLTLAKKAGNEPKQESSAVMVDRRRLEGSIEILLAIMGDPDYGDVNDMISIVVDSLNQAKDPKMIGNMT